MQVFLFVFLLVISSCAISGKNLKQADIEQFRLGYSTIRDVETALGEPSSKSTDSLGYQHLYYINNINYVKGESFIPYFGQHVGGSIDKSRIYTFSFDHDLILRNISFKTKKSDGFNSALPSHPELD